MLRAIFYKWLSPNGALKDYSQSWRLGQNITIAWKPLDFQLADLWLAQVNSLNFAVLVKESVDTKPGGKIDFVFPSLIDEALRDNRWIFRFTAHKSPPAYEVLAPLQQWPSRAFILLPAGGVPDPIASASMTATTSPESTLSASTASSLVSTSATSGAQRSGASSTPTHHRRVTYQAAIGIGVGAAVFAALAVCLVAFLCVRRRRRIDSTKSFSGSSSTSSQFIVSPISQLGHAQACTYSTPKLHNKSIPQDSHPAFRSSKAQTELAPDCIIAELPESDTMELEGRMISRSPTVVPESLTRSMYGTVRKKEDSGGFF
ncbi:MAG: hypothetical protein M1814_000400 [Vezdaea aestivalis]|nr:MAG: hypothetical protein M1814_000400 [Vezdaea aestivalis]